MYTPDPLLRRRRDHHRPRTWNLMTWHGMSRASIHPFTHSSSPRPPRPTTVFLLRHLPGHRRALAQGGRGDQGRPRHQAPRRLRPALAARGLHQALRVVRRPVVLFLALSLCLSLFDRIDDDPATHPTHQPTTARAGRSRYPSTRTASSSRSSASSTSGRGRTSPPSPPTCHTSTSSVMMTKCCELDVWDGPVGKHAAFTHSCHVLSSPLACTYNPDRGGPRQRAGEGHPQAHDPDPRGHRHGLPVAVPVRCQGRRLCIYI